MAINQAERTRRSRAKILEAALELFSRGGYRGTSMREIADEAGVSTGNVYHQFPDKEALFITLLDEYWQLLSAPDHPLNQALAGSLFPDQLEEIGEAAKAGIEKYRRFVKLIYVDVVEFEGEHVRRFYASMPERFSAFVHHHPTMLSGSQHLRDGIDPSFAVMLASRVFLQYFAVEVLFGVKDHYGRDSKQVIHEISDVLRHGILPPAAKS